MYSSKANAIMIMSIISIILSIGVFASLIITFLLPVFEVINQKQIDDSVFAGQLLGIVVTSIILFVNVILSWTCTLMVMASTWHTPVLNNDKILWGLLSIFLIGSIGTLVFSVKARKQNPVGTTTSITATNNANVI